MQDDGQLLLDPEQAYGEHDGLPTPPLASVVHVPLTAAPSAVEHTLQEPTQAEEQQTLSEQAFDRHWSFAVQATPCVERATHTLPLQ